MKKILSVLLAITLCVSALPLSSIVVNAQVSTTEHTVENISAAPMRNLVEYSDGHWNQTYNGTEYINRYFHYDPWKALEYTVTYDNGQIVVGDMWCLIEKFGEQPNIVSNQSYENQFGLGKHTFDISFMGASCQVEVEIEASPIESISAVANKPYVINSDGLWYYKDEDPTKKYFNYSVTAYDFDYTISYDGGQTFTGDYWAVEEKFGFIPTVETDQSYENQWGLGEHSAKVIFMGAEYNALILIKDSNVNSISAVPTKQFMENVDGQWSNGYFEENNEHSYFEYTHIEFALEYTVNYDDNQTFTGEYWDLYYQFGLCPQVEAPQSYENQWGVGIHTVTVSFMNATCEVDIEVINNPVESITAAPTRNLIEYSDGYWRQNDNGNKYFEYEPWRVFEYTVICDNGQTLVGDLTFLQSTFGYSPDITSEQSYENQWGLGKHTFDISFMAANCQVEVEIEESYIESISATPIRNLIENCDGAYEPYWNDDDQIGEYYFNYFMDEVLMFTVTYSGGQVFSGKNNDVYEHFGFSVQVTSDQSAQNPWGLGKHTANVRFMGAECSVEIEVEKSIVEKIVATPVKPQIIENTGGYWQSSPDGETEYFYYYAPEFTYTVTYSGGQTFTGNRDELYEKFGFYPSVNANQWYDNQWGLGKHNVNINFMGATCTAEIEIIKNPIESITAVSTKNLIENYSGYINEYDWNEETEEYNPPYFNYNCGTDVFEYTITYSGGQVFTGGEYDVYEKFGYYPSISYDQCYENQWGLGKHTVTVDFMGVACDAEIEIVKNPIESITAVAKHDLMEDIDCSIFTDENENNYRYYNLYEALEYTVTYDGGQTFIGERNAVEEKFGNWVSINDNQAYNNEFALGKNSIEIALMGIKGTATINIVKCAYKAIKISGENELKITLTKNDDSTVDAEIISCYHEGGGLGGFSSVLETTAGTFYCAAFNWKVVFEGEDAFEYENKDLQLRLGTLQSNKIDCNYAKALMDSRSLYNIISNHYISTGLLFDFNGTTYSSLEDMAIFACWTTGTIWSGEDNVDEDGKAFALLDASLVNESIKEVFGIVVDVKLSDNYDSETGKIKLFIPEYNAVKEDGKIAFENGKWIYNQTVNDDLVISIKLNQDLTVNSIKMFDPNSLPAVDTPMLFAVGDTSVELTSVNGYEYSKDGTNWQDSNVFTGLSPNTTYYFYQRIKETDYGYPSESSVALIVTTNKSSVAKPSAPTLLSKSQTKITLVAVNGYEYSKDGVIWQSSNVFDGLTPDTAYSFYQRVAETNTHNPSESSLALVVKTANTYVVGDLNGDETVTDADAVFLLMNTFFPEDYEVNQSVDYNGDGAVNDADAVYLLMYTFFPEDYPIAK